MNQRLELAIRDNVELCAAVCQTHGIASREVKGIWRTLSPAPANTPDVITTDAALSSRQVARVLAETGGASVKDSFATLDPAPHGFDTLFRAEWIWLEPEKDATPVNLAWQTLADSADLAGWRAAHGSADSILPALVTEPGITVLRGRSSPGTVVGALVSTKAGVAGVSNVFANGLSSSNAWRELVAHIRSSWPGQPIVGYEHGADLAAAIDAGFEPIGPLQVWLKQA